MGTTSYQRQQAAHGLEQLASLIRAQSWRADATPSLPPTQAAILRLLEGGADGQAKQLAARLGVSRASLSDSLKALESKGWIERRVNPDDKRASILRLTRTGRGLAQKLLSPLHGIGALVEHLGENDLGALLRVTQLLVREAQHQGLATGPRTCLSCRYFRPYATGDAHQPHFCAFVEKPFGDHELRVDCAEQAPADERYAEGSYQRFLHPVPP